MDLYYIGMILYIYGMKPCMILYIYGMKPYHICIKSYGVIVSHTGEGDLFPTKSDRCYILYFFISFTSRLLCNIGTIWNWTILSAEVYIIVSGWSFFPNIMISL